MTSACASRCPGELADRTAGRHLVAELPRDPLGVGGRRVVPRGHDVAIGIAGHPAPHQPRAIHRAGAAPPLRPSWGRRAGLTVVSGGIVRMRVRIDAMITSKSPSSSPWSRAHPGTACRRRRGHGSTCDGSSRSPVCARVEHAELHAVGDQQVALGQRSVGITTHVGPNPDRPVGRMHEDRRVDGFPQSKATSMWSQWPWVGDRDDPPPTHGLDDRGRVVDASITTTSSSPPTIQTLFCTSWAGPVVVLREGADEVDAAGHLDIVAARGRLTRCASARGRSPRRTCCSAGWASPSGCARGARCCGPSSGSCAACTRDARRRLRCSSVRAPRRRPSTCPRSADRTPQV